MPVPKRKTSKARRDQRHSTRYIRPQAITKCLNCEHVMSPHQACLECGFYKGRKVLRTKQERTISRVEHMQALRAKQAKQEAPVEEQGGQQ